MSPTPTDAPAPTPLRIGVLGCANIARAFIRDVRPSPAVQVVAVASRKAETAAAFAAETGVARHLGSYQALLDDPGVDAVYIPLPNTLHAPWAIKAARAGKHVLCEKPLATSLADARAMFAAARRHRVMLLEAYPYWFQPQTGELVRLLAEGAIGDVRFIQASFGFSLPPNPANIRLQPQLGGGALLDAGSYPMSLIRLVMGQAPQRVRADASWAPTGVDINLSATLYFADGRRALLSCAMDAAPHRHALIAGSQGVIETEYLNHTALPAPALPHPLGWQPSLMRLRRGAAFNLPLRTVHSPVGSGFRFAAEAFADVVARRDQAAIARAAAASLDIAATLEALAVSAREGREVALPAG